ncbi:MAG TPA: hypothetical protein VK604_23330 [Bryobacteraceae bacterium]|nr:hypothetical protein [Bryobacteraceae bacterium]
MFQSDLKKCDRDVNPIANTKTRFASLPDRAIVNFSLLPTALDSIPPSQVAFMRVLSPFDTSLKLFAEKRGHAAFSNSTKETELRPVSFLEIRVSPRHGAGSGDSILQAYNRLVLASGFGRARLSSI